MSERIKVRKANRTVRVTENELDRYLANGYTIVQEQKVSQPKVETPKATVSDTVVEPKLAKTPQTNKRRKSTK